MMETMSDILAQGNFDWMENLVGIIVIAFVVLGNVANALIKGIKEKKERERKHTTPTSRPSSAQPRGGAPSAYPTARPRPPRPEVARPVPPARPTAPQQPATELAPEAQPPRPAPTLGIPRELLPEGLEEVLAEIVPQLVRPKPRPQTPPPAQHPPVRKTRKAAAPHPRSAPPSPRPEQPSSSRPTDPAKRLGTLTSNLDAEPPREPSVAAHVESHISHLDHPVSDATIGTLAHGRRRPTRAALRHAIIMNEIISPPRALRPLEDLF